MIGQKFVKPFRDHHVDPMEMTRGDFIAVNADNVFVCLPVIIPAFFFLDIGRAPLHRRVHRRSRCRRDHDQPAAQVGAHAHRASTRRDRPAHGVVLSKEHHSVHHSGALRPQLLHHVGLPRVMLNRFVLLTQAVGATRSASRPSSRVRLASATSPPLASASWRTIARPSPDPSCPALAPARTGRRHAAAGRPASRATVGHVDGAQPFSSPTRLISLPGCAGVEGVVDVVVDDLLERARHGPGRDVAIVPAVTVTPRSSASGAQIAGTFGDDVGHVDRSICHGSLLRAGKHQQALDQALQPFGFFARRPRCPHGPVRVRFET